MDIHRKKAKTPDTPKARQRRQFIAVQGSKTALGILLCGSFIYLKYRQTFATKSPPAEEEKP